MTSNLTWGLASRVAAKYKSKREVPRTDGDGTTTIYEYSEKQVENRHKEKATRIEALRKKMTDLRAKARGDLDSKDPKTRLIALAVCLMDETYERVGNAESAKSGHFGVTTWKAEHVKVSPKKAVIVYVGKSGVEQEKEVTHAKVLAALKRELEGKKKSDNLFACDDCTVSAGDVNAYLKAYDVTAKDIRGLHANEEMRRNLKKVRSEGGALPKDKKKKEEALKAEFNKALEASAAAVGHEPATLRGQYLVPGLEDEYLKKGEVLDKLDKKAGVLWATLSDSEKEDREAERLVQQSPKKKPPRNDLRRSTPQDEDKDPDKEQDRKDRSNNYKDASSSVRVALLWLSAIKRKKLTTVRRKEDGKIVQVSDKTLKSEPGKYDKLDPEEIEKAKKKQSPSDEEAPAAPPTLDDVRKGLMSKYQALGLTDYEVDQRLDLLVSRGAKPEEVDKLLQQDSQKSSVQLKMKGGLPALRDQLLKQYTDLGVPKSEAQKTVDLVQQGIQERDLDEIKKILEDRAQEINETKSRKEEILKGGVRTPSALKKFKKEISDLYSDLGVDSETISEELDALQAGASGEELEGIIKVFEDKAGDVAKEKERAENKKVYKKVRSKPLSEALEVVGEGNADAVKDYLSGMPPEDFSDFQKTLTAEFKRLQDEGPGDLDSFNDALDSDNKSLEGTKGLGDLKDPQGLARALARRKYKDQVLDDPASDPDDPLPKPGSQPSEDEAEKVLDRAEKAVSKYREMPLEERKSHLSKIESQIKDLPEGDPRRKHLEAIKKGIGVASALTEGMGAEGIGGATARLIAAADKSGNLRKILAMNSSEGGSEEERVEASRRDQELIREIFESVDDDDWGELLPEDHPGRGMADFLGEDGGRSFSEEERSILRSNLADMMIGELQILEPEIDDQVDTRATRRVREDVARAARRDRPGDWSGGVSKIKSWVADFLKDLAENAKSRVQDFVSGGRRPTRSAPPVPDEATPEEAPPVPDEAPPDQASPARLNRRRLRQKKTTSPARVASMYLIYSLGTIPR